MATIKNDATPEELGGTYWTYNGIQSHRRFGLSVQVRHEPETLESKYHLWEYRVGQEGTDFRFYSESTVAPTEERLNDLVVEAIAEGLKCGAFGVYPRPFYPKCDKWDRFVNKYALSDFNPFGVSPFSESVETALFALKRAYSYFLAGEAKQYRVDHWNVRVAPADGLIILTLLDDAGFAMTPEYVDALASYVKETSDFVHISGGAGVLVFEAKKVGMVTLTAVAK